MDFGKLELDPANSPAVLDTATWDSAVAAKAIRQFADHWSEALDRAARRVRPVTSQRGVPVICSSADREGETALLVRLSDEQRVFLQLGTARKALALGAPFYRLRLATGRVLTAHSADAATIDKYCDFFQPANAPRVLGGIARLGIGSRMTTKLWPGVFAAMDRGGFSANTIQNSVRELNLLDDLRDGRPPVRNYASGFGMIESGYTGSTFEGLWVAGVLAALEHESPLRYGADADHVQVKRADLRLQSARRLLSAARYYSFFTLDVADILDYDGSGAGRGPDESLPSEKEWAEVQLYHGSASGFKMRRIAPQAIDQSIRKYWRALDATTTLASEIARLRHGKPFDLEFAFDEHPPEIRASDCVSTEEEVIFVIREIMRRKLPISHIAPNFGVEKGYDYRLADGLQGLRKRIEASHRLAQDAGLMLDIHSADDLGSDARRTIGRATAGKLHFKISPSLHLIFAQTVRDYYPEIFQKWWNDALAYASLEAERGSALGSECLAEYRSMEHPSPSPKLEVFRQFFFAFPGRRDASGRFTNREMFYTLSEEFYRAYQEKVAKHLCTLSDDLFAAQEVA